MVNTLNKTDLINEKISVCLSSSGVSGQQLRSAHYFLGAELAKQIKKKEKLVRWLEALQIANQDVMLPLEREELDCEISELKAELVGHRKELSECEKDLEASIAAFKKGGVE